MKSDICGYIEEITSLVFCKKWSRKIVFPPCRQDAAVQKKGIMLTIGYGHDKGRTGRKRGKVKNHGAEESTGGLRACVYGME